MAVGGSRFDNPNYKNWLKDTLALMYMKEGLEDFSDAISKLFHAKLLSSCGTGTSRCTSGCTFRDLIRDTRNQRWYIRCKHCDKWLKEFIYHHTDMPCPKLSPENTDPQKWYLDHWETSKLFMSYGCRTDTCAKDCDIHGILSLFINSQYFFTSRHIGRADLLDELLEIRNALFHSGTFQVSDTAVNNDLQKIIDFLQGMTGLTGSQTQKIQDAVQKIQNLKANRLDLSLNKELELRALQQKQIEMDREMKRLENTMESLKKEQDSLKTTVDSQDTKLSSNDTAIKQHGDSIKELLDVKVQFNQFLTLNGIDKDFKKFVNTFYEHEQNIGQLDRVSKQHEQSIGQLDTVSKQHEQHIGQLDTVSKQHEQHIGQLDTVSKQHEQHIGQLDTVSKQNKQRIEQLDGRTHTHESDIGLIGDKITELDEHIKHDRELQSKTMALTRNKEVTVLHSRMQAVDGELANLSGKCSDIDKTRQDLSRTRQELQSLNDDYTNTKTLIKQLEESKKTFEKFLHDNELVQDLARLSTRLQEHDQKLNQQDQELNEQKQRIDQQDQVVNQRLEQQEHNTDCLSQRIDEQDQKILTLAEHVTSKPDAPVAGSSRSWDDKCKDLRALLMSHYRHYCLVIENPLDTNDVGLEYMYVAPAIKILRESMGRDGLGNVQEEVTNMSCNQVFYTKDYQCRNIYITGDAGTGKSMLCRNIVRLWCEAHGGLNIVEREESDNDSDEDDENMLERRQSGKTRHERSKDGGKANRQMLSQFKLLFYITLRDSLSEYKITDMIQSQILQHYDTIEGLKVSALLKNECCLVICDGLDEWVCPEGSTVPHFVNPGIPGRDITFENSVFLTTTRPWKFDVLQLKSSEVDKHVELIGISEQSASQLCSKVIKILRKSKTCCKTKRDFLMTLEHRDLDHFKMIPVILVQLICLWFECQDLPKSQVQLYCDILEHLLRKAEKNISKETSITSKDVQTNKPLPECFKDHPCCQSHKQLIFCLSRVAFEALFDKTRENRLVFRSSQMELFGIGQEEINVCLRSGILSQSKVLDKVSVSEKKISFLHKKFQEFLASLFIAGYVDSPVSDQQMAKKASKIPINHMTDFCNTIGTCLEMSQVYMFMSGLRPDLTQQLLTQFTHVVTADKHKQLQKYRQTFLVPHLIRDIQACITDCVVEGSYHGYTYDNLCLADFYITKTTLCHVKPLFVCTERSKVKSVWMKTEGTDKDQLRAITSQLQHCHSVQRLHLNDPKPCYIHVDTVTVIVNNNINTLTSLFLFSHSTATDELVTALCSLSSSKCLMALGLTCYMTHKHKEQIIARFSQSPTIRQLGLALVCTDHDNQCRARIDVSTMTHKQILDLWYMSVDNLQSVSHCVEGVSLRYVTLPVTALHEFTRSISQTTRYVWVELDNVTVTEVTDGQVDMETFLRTCPGLKVTKCQYNDSNKTWSIDFTTSRH